MDLPELLDYLSADEACPVAMVAELVGAAGALEAGASMNRPLCIAPNCRILGQHRDGCEGDCKGCLPRVAADGLMLCGGHLRGLGEDAKEAAHLYDELGLVLMRTGRGGEKVSGSSAGAPVPRDKVMDMRAEIRAVLVGYSKLIAEERGWTLPADNVRAMGEYVARDPRWLAAGEYADEASEELGSLRRRSWSVAYPNGTKVVEVGPCPKAVNSAEESGTAQPCAGTLRAVVRPADQMLPSEVVCDADPSHRWDSTQWRQLDRLVSGRRAA